MPIHEGRKADTMGYRTKFISYAARREPKSDFYCVACQKDMDPQKPCRAVHMIDGGYYALHPSEEPNYVPDGGDMGCWPIGNDCAKKLGIEWTFAPALFAKGAP